MFVRKYQAKIQIYKLIVFTLINIQMSLLNADNAAIIITLQKMKHNASTIKKIHLLLIWKGAISNIRMNNMYV